eukprot:3912629-Rhodomonas_salina.2
MLQLEPPCALSAPNIAFGADSLKRKLHPLHLRFGLLRRAISFLTVCVAMPATRFPAAHSAQHVHVRSAIKSALVNTTRRRTSLAH